jgi:integrase
MRRLAKIEEDLRLDRWVDPDGGKTPLVDWAWRWFDSWVDLKPKTRVSYASLLRNQILPTFGRRQLSRIRPIDVQEWIAGMQNLDLSASRVRQANHLLGSIMKAAIAEGMVAGNPCLGARLPRMPRREMAYFTAAQVEQIARAIRPPYGVLVHVFAYGGLRFGEGAALRRNDCDLERARVRVDESLADVNGILHFGSTKTHQQRYVVIPPFLVAMLREHLADHVGAEHDALVFTSPDGGPLRYGNFARRFWKRALGDAGLEPTGLHALRHTCATLLIAHGAPIKAVQAQLGHQSAELTLDRYGHLYPDQMDVLAGRLEEARAQTQVPRP